MDNLWSSLENIDRTRKSLKLKPTLACWKNSLINIALFSQVVINYRIILIDDKWYVVAECYNSTTVKMQLWKMTRIVLMMSYTEHGVRVKYSARFFNYLSEEATFGEACAYNKLAWATTSFTTFTHLSVFSVLENLEHSGCIAFGASYSSGLQANVGHPQSLQAR